MLNCQCGEGAVLDVEAHHLAEIDGAKNIDIVDEKRLVLVPEAFKKEP